MFKSMKNDLLNYRSPLLAGLFAALALAIALPAQAQETLRIGYQKSSTLITLLKTQGTLEKALAPQHVNVTWHEFPSGLPLLEALNVGNVDISADVADTVPIFAQAAQARLTYFAQEAASPSAQGDHRSQRLGRASNCLTSRARKSPSPRQRVPTTC
ncbi:hypothetical protein CU661_14370 [Pseudomonas syringae pv. actinidifoliorum]|nr:hypothetical protein [Pseudomonas syringae pv. actinidifoliorum]